MKKIIQLLFITLIFFPIEVLAESRCIGTEVEYKILAGKKRFSHCNKGDIISVYSTSLVKSFPNTTSLNNIPSFSLREDEVGSLCSFEKQIVPIGKTTVIASATAGVELPVDVNWFDCVYIGDERDSILPE